VGEAIGHLAGLLEGGIVEVRVEVGLVVAHGLTIPGSSATLHQFSESRRGWSGSPRTLG
jgi:hypothetical protein